MVQQLGTLQHVQSIVPFPNEDQSESRAHTQPSHQVHQPQNDLFRPRRELSNVDEESYLDCSCISEEAVGNTPMDKVCVIGYDENSEGQKSKHGPEHVNE